MFLTREAFDAIGGFRTSALSGPDNLTERLREIGFVPVYEPRCVVVHPARTEWSSIRAKIRRMAHAAHNRGRRVRRAMGMVVPSTRLAAYILQNRANRVHHRLVFFFIHVALRAYGAYHYLKGGPQPER